MKLFLHPPAANQTFLVSDGEDVSTTELLRRMGQAMGRPARLIPVPVNWLKLAAAMVGKPTWQSMTSGAMDCRASLAMTEKNIRNDGEEYLQWRRRIFAMTEKYSQ